MKKIELGNLQWLLNNQRIETTLELELIFKNINEEDIFGEAYLDFIEVETKDRDYLIEWYRWISHLNSASNSLVFRLDDIHNYDMEEDKDLYIFDDMTDNDWKEFSDSITKVTFGVATDIDSENIELANNEMYFNEHRVNLDKCKILFRVGLD